MGLIGVLSPEKMAEARCGSEQLQANLYPLHVGAVLPEVQKNLGGSGPFAQTSILIPGL